MPIPEMRNHAIELDSKARFGEDQIQRPHDRGGGADRLAIDPKPIGQLAQNTEHLARLFLLQPHQLVVQIDGFERLQKQRLAGRTRAVNHARQLAALP